MPEVKNRIERGTLLAIVALLILTVLMTYPASFRLSTQLMASQGDAWQFPWNIFNFREHLLHGQDPYYSDFIFHPVGARLLLHNYTELHGMLSLALSPFFNDIALNNLFVLLATFLSGLGMYLLCKEVTGSTAGALFSAVGFAFCPVRMFWITSQTHMALTGWIPFAIWAFLKTGDTRKSSYAVLTGVFFALAGYCNYYFAIYLFIAFLTILAYGLWTFPEWRSRDLMLKLTVSGFVAILLLSPVAFEFLQSYRERTVYSYSSAEDFAAQKSATLLQYVRIGAMNPYLRKLLGENPMIFPASRLTPGWILLFLGTGGLVIALIRKNLRVTLFFVLGAVFLLLSFGPYIEIGSFTIPLPFDVITRIPYLNHLRFAWRFAVMVAFSLAFLAGYLISVLLQKFPGKASAVAAASCFGLLLFELSPAPVEMEAFDPPQVFHDLGAGKSDVMLSVPYYPSVGWESRYMCYQMIHKQKLLDGRISRPPQPQVDYFRRIPIAESLRGISSFRRQATSGMITEDRESASFFLGFFRIRHLSLFPPYSSRPDVLRYVTEVFPQARLIADQKDIKVYSLPEDEITTYRLVAGDSILQLFLLSAWDEDGAGDQRVVSSKQKEARLLLPEAPAARSYSLILRMRSMAAKKARVEAGAFRQDIDLGPDFEFYKLEIPAAEVRNSHSVLKIEAFSGDPSENQAFLELRSLKLSIE